MKFMMIVKSAERFGHPPKDLMEAIDKLSEEANKSGSMIGGGGLGPTALGARVRLSDGKVTVIDGPFSLASVKGPSITVTLPSERRTRAPNAVGPSPPPPIIVPAFAASWLRDRKSVG